jgi:hypothetical protein
MALAVSYAGAAILGVSDVLPGELQVALTPVERVEHPSEDGGINIVRVDPAPTGVSAGIQLGLIGLLLGGVPVAIVGTVLAASNRGRRWSRTWGSVFLAGFVFQLSSVVFTAFLLILLLWLAYEATAWEILAFAGPLLFGVVCGLWGVRSWRVLQHQLQELPLTIAPHEGAA